MLAAGGPTNIGYYCWPIVSCIYISLVLEVRSLPSLFEDHTTCRIIANWEIICELRFRSGLSLASEVMGIVCSSLSVSARMKQKFKVQIAL